MKTEIKESLIFAVIFFLLVCLFTTCTPYRYLNKHHDEICNKCIDEYTRKLPTTDTTSIKTDTTKEDGPGLTYDLYQQLLFECDSNNQVQLICQGKIIDSLTVKNNVSKKQIGELLRLQSFLTFKNGKLIINNKVYQDSILELKKLVTILKKEAQVITPPPIEIITNKIPVIVWVVISILGLIVIAGTIYIIKK